MLYNRSESRETAMKILYQVFLYEGNKIPYRLEEIKKENIEIENEFINLLVEGVIEKKKELDSIINKNLKNWTIERLGKTDQAILRLAVYELIHTDTPDVVCINEAIELSKKYSDEKIKNMINGVLDNILKTKELN